MNQLTKFAVAAALVGASASASAWWESTQPLSAQPPVPYAVPPLTEAQQAAITAQQQAFAEQQTKMMQQAIEAQRQMAEQVAAQQAKLAQEWQERSRHAMAFDPMSTDPFATLEPPAPPAMEMPSVESPFGPPLPEHVKKAMEESNAYAKKRIEESNARFEQSRKEMAAQREALIKAMETDRKERFARPVPVAYRAPEKSAM